jgi:hypothetical protein|tara:strand:- start:4248 stop:4610 length:363 start_codon:yes stop_codon:yes gene_type:complete
MKAAKTQSDMNLNFDGMEKMSPKHSSKYMTNHYSGTMNDGALINKGRGPTVGNKSDDDSTYPDAARVPKSGKGKDMFMGSANPQVRTPGGTRAWEPKGTQNYVGDADRINKGRGPTKGNE